MLLLNTKDLKFALFGDRLNDQFYKLKEFRPLLRDFLLQQSFVYILPQEPMLSINSAGLISSLASLLLLGNVMLKNDNTDQTYRNFLQLKSITPKSYKKVIGTYITNGINNMLSDNALKELAHFLYSNATADIDDRLKKVIIAPDEIIKYTKNRINELAERIPIFVPNEVDVNINISNTYNNDPMLEIINKIMSLLANVNDIILVGYYGIQLLKTISNQIGSEIPFISRVIEKLIDNMNTAANENNTAYDIFNSLSAIITLVYFIVHQRQIMLPKTFVSNEITTTATLNFQFIAETPEQIIDNIYIPLAYLTSLATPIKVNIEQMLAEQMLPQKSSNSIITKLNDLIVGAAKAMDRGPFVMQPLYLTVFIPGKVFIPLGMITDISIDIENDYSYYGGHPKKVEVNVKIEDLSSGHAIFTAGTENNFTLRKLPAFSGLLLYDALKKDIIELINMFEDSNYNLNFKNEEPNIITLRGNILTTFVPTLELNQTAIVNQFQPQESSLIYENIIPSGENLANLKQYQGVSNCKNTTVTADDIVNNKANIDASNENCMISCINKNITCLSGTPANAKFSSYTSQLHAAPFKAKLTNFAIKDPSSVNTINSTLYTNFVAFYKANFNQVKTKNPTLVESINNSLIPVSMLWYCMTIAAGKLGLNVNVNDDLKAVILGGHLINMAGESKFNPMEVSFTGATGLGQINQTNAINILKGLGINIDRQNFNRCVVMDPILNLYSTAYVYMNSVGRDLLKNGLNPNSYIPYTGEYHANVARNRYEQLYALKYQYTKTFEILIAYVKTANTQINIFNGIVNYYRSYYNEISQGKGTYFATNC